jgi:hypothetical protein
MDPTIMGALIGGVLATIGGVLGGIVTGWFTLRANQQSLAHEARREERERGLHFRQEQLSQFYGPVLACMEELEECWQLLSDADKNVEAFAEAHRDKHLLSVLAVDKKKAVIEYKQYLYSREVDVFTKIKEIFISQFGLAEPSTKENYRTVVRFIENRNIINVTERKLDITFTGEDVSGLRGRIASLFQNLIDINAQIRSQLESGEPRPISQESYNSPESKSPHLSGKFFSNLPEESFKPAAALATTGASDMSPKESTLAPDKSVAGKNWPGRYTLLANKGSFQVPARAPEGSTKDVSKP